jgi:uroporphyrinogen-III synthase
MRVLVTRPAEDAGPLARALEAMGAEPVLFPLTRIELLPLPPLDWEGVAGTIVTSKNALRAIAGTEHAGARNRPLFCTGKGTAAMAHALGFPDVCEGPGTATGLPDTIGARLPAGARLLYLAGVHLAFDMDSALTSRGYSLQKIVCYEAVAVTQFSPEIASRLRQRRLDAVILMSPRAARIFGALVTAGNFGEDAAHLLAYCLSGTIAKTLQTAAEGRKRVAGRPDLEALLDLLRIDMAQDGTMVS